MHTTDLFPKTMPVNVSAPVSRSILENVKTARCGRKNWHRCDMGNSDCPFKCVKAEPLSILPDLNTNMDAVEARQA